MAEEENTFGREENYEVAKRALAPAAEEPRGPDCLMPDRRGRGEPLRGSRALPNALFLKALGLSLQPGLPPPPATQVCR